MLKYAVQMTVADSRDGALSGSTLREACSWGKVDVVHEQMVFGELSALFPILASDAYHRAEWKKRKPFKFADLYEKQAAERLLTEIKTSRVKKTVGKLGMKQTAGR